MGSEGGMVVDWFTKLFQVSDNHLHWVGPWLQHEFAFKACDTSTSITVSSSVSLEFVILVKLHGY